MAKVLCKLPNASSLINGVRFVTHRDGMLSEEIEDDVALGFSNIAGYEIYDPEAAAKAKAAAATNPSSAGGASSQPGGSPAAPPAGPGGASSTTSNPSGKTGATDPTF